MLKKLFKNKNKIKVYDGRQTVINSKGEEAEEDCYTLITQKDINDFTKSIKVPDVKNYLLKEYENNFELEEEIKRLNIQIKNYKLVEEKYEALLIIQEKTTEREKILKEERKELKKEISSLEEEAKILKGKITDAIQNSKDIEMQYKNKEKELVKERKIFDDERSQIIQKFVNEYKQSLVEKISNIKGNISKSKVIEIIREI